MKIEMIEGVKRLVMKVVRNPVTQPEVTRSCSVCM